MEQDIQNIDKILSQYETSISHRRGGEIADRVDHVLSSYKRIADNAINRTRTYLQDTRSQFRALEIVLEGLTSEGMNHGQKRVIANHIISMLRTMGDKLDQTEYDYNLNVIDRYNFWRSNTPERRLYEDRANLKRTVEDQQRRLKFIEDKHPDIFKGMTDELPF